MSKANVVQEPSMDEILASIRRIIETGDEKASGASREAVAGVARQIPAFLAGTQVQDFADAPGTGADPLRREAPSASATPSLRFAPEPAAHSGQPVADDDALTAELETELAATWERIEVRRDGSQPFAPAPEPLRPSNSGTDVMSNEPDMRPFAAQPLVGGHDHASLPIAPQPSHSNSYEAPMERNAFEPANTDARAADERPAATSRYGDTPPPLVSPATGQLVGASFNELAEAIRQGELRSLETMAQEMLQPMLREWLDDNLPKMVERLIREEIERLARGGVKR